MKLWVFVSLSSDSWQFQKQLMTKSETHLSFKPLGSREYIKRKIISNKRKSQKGERFLPPCLSYLYGNIKWKKVS